MFEMGSFIELQLPQTGEYFDSVDKERVMRLNSGRTAIYHALRVMNCKTIWLPIYQCETVKNFLISKKINIKYYHIDESFNPIDIEQKINESVLLVNYFGIMSSVRMKKLSDDFHNVIIDNSQAFFSEPLDGCISVYSARKFIGVCDGSYVIGEGANKYSQEYEQGFSSDTSLFLMQRIEYGCEGKTYAARTMNEKRIDNEDVMRMSKLTQYILNGTDYKKIINKRRQNFEIASGLFQEQNMLNTKMYYDDSCVPMVYPLLLENDNLLEKLLEKKHFQGHWWKYILEETKKEDFENYMSRFMLPITIDQRYGKEEIEYIHTIINGVD